MLLKKFKHHFAEIGKRISSDGFDLVHLNHNEPKVVNLNHYESYMTSGVLADNSKLLIHHSDARRIRDEKTSIRHGYSYTSRGNKNESELRVLCTHASINFAFFYKTSEIPYIRITSRLAGSHYPNIDHESYMSPDELRIQLNTAIATDLKGSELLIHIIDNIAKAPSSSKDIQEGVIDRKNQLNSQFFEFADTILSDYADSKQESPETAQKIVDEYKDRVTKLINIECCEEDQKIAELEAKLAEVRKTRQQKVKKLIDKVEKNKENAQAVTIQNLRNEGSDKLTSKLYKLCDFYNELPENDKPLVAPALKDKIREMIDIYHSYSQYKLDKYAIKHISVHANITL